LIKNGPATLTLSAANSYSGTTTVNNGTLLVSGSIGSNTTVNGGTLAGGGTINGTLVANSGGNVAPGTSPGILHTGSVSFAAGSSLSVEIGGTSPGTGAGFHDQ